MRISVHIHQITIVSSVETRKDSNAPKERGSKTQGTQTDGDERIMANDNGNPIPECITVLSRELTTLFKENDIGVPPRLTEDGVYACFFQYCYRNELVSLFDLQIIFPDATLCEMLSLGTSGVKWRDIESRLKSERLFITYLKNESAFSRPVFISKALRDFLRIDKEPNPITRETITRCICAYIKEKGLQDPLNPRIICCDDVLRKLFPESGDPYSYYSMQVALRQHIYCES